MLADAYNVTSGMIDAIVWVLVYGSIAAIIYGIIRIIKSSGRKAKTSVSEDPTDFTFLSKLRPPSIRELEGRPITQPHWLADPAKHYDERMWDGNKWSRQVRQTGGVDFWQLRRPAEAAATQTTKSRLETNANGDNSPAETVVRQVASQNIVADLKELTTLFDRGALTIDEFTTAKKRLLGEIANHE